MNNPNPEHSLNQAENSPKDLPSIEVNAATTEILGVELPLADSHLGDLAQTQFGFIEREQTVPGSSPNDSGPQITTKNIAFSEHLPAVLVDVKLLEEIASIPDRFGFKIGDVADLLEIKQYILRYWEQEFDLLKPKKASNNQRLYTKKDVENAFLIRKLLYRDKFSIEGARQAMRDVRFAVKKEKDYSSALMKIDQNQSQHAADLRDLVQKIRQLKEMFL